MLEKIQKTDVSNLELTVMYNIREVGFTKQ